MADESDFQLQNSAQAIEFARECVRSVILANGGAAVAVLAFRSSEVSENPGVRMAIRSALEWFSIGVSLGILACITGYIAQTLFAAKNADRQRGREPGSKPEAVSWIGVMLVSLSVLAFILGLWRAASAI